VNVLRRGRNCARLLLLPLAIAGCAAATTSTTTTPTASGSTQRSWDRPQYRSTYRRTAEPPVFIRNATIMTAAGPELPNASIHIREGRIVAVGTDLTPPS
jgi:hypothetical protein